MLVLCLRYGLLETDPRALFLSYGFEPGEKAGLLLFPFAQATTAELAGVLLGLWLFGAVVEDRLGSLGFLALFFLLNWTFAGCLRLWEEILGGPASRALGSSGAVSGLIGLVAARFLASGVRVSFRVPGLVFTGEVRLPNWLLALFWLPVAAIPLALGGDKAWALSQLSMLALGRALGRWVVLKSPVEDLMRKGSDLLEAKMQALALVEFEKARVLDPGNPLIQEKLGVCCFALREPGVKEDVFALRAQRHFVRALELYSAQENMMPALLLYQKLLKFLSPGAVPAEVARPLMDFQEREKPLGVALSSDPMERREKLQGHFLELVNQGTTQAAFQVLKDLLQEPDAESLAPNILEAGGMLCRRLGEKEKAEDLFHWLARSGGRVQTFKALLFLHKSWRSTPKQRHLPELCRRAEERLPELLTDPDWEELRKAIE